MQEMNVNLDDISTEELIKLYHKHWTGSISSFAKQHSLNRGNFSSWLSGKKSSSVSENVVKKYLEGLWSETKTEEKAISILPSSNITLSEECMDTQMEKHQLTTSRLTMRDIKTKLKVNSPASMIKIVTLANDGLEKLFFVDIDNMIGNFAKELSIFDNIPNVHIIIFISNKTISSHVNDTLTKPWFSLMRAKTISKNAADILMATTASSFNLLLPESISFYLISNDGFIGELKEIIHSVSPQRECVCGTPEIVLSFVQRLLSKQDIIQISHFSNVVVRAEIGMSNIQ